MHYTCRPSLWLGFALKPAPFNKTLSGADICIGMSKRIPIQVGERFGKLVAERRAPNSTHGQQRWLFHCDCNGTTITSARNVRTGKTKSCGCLVSWHHRRDSATKKFLVPDGYEPWYSMAREHWIANYADGCNLEDFIRLSQLPCHYCGRSRVGKRTRHPNTKYAVTFEYNGLDRIDSEKDHSIENIVPCCKVCNSAKSNRSYQDFCDWIQSVHSHLFAA
jgi:5-methylcytosine-specific restriction endonuclease McrA